MENNQNKSLGQQEQEKRLNEELNIMNTNSHVKPTTHNDMAENKKPESEIFPDGDPAVINPEELASFPPEAERSGDVDIEAEKDSHLVNKRTPVRNGRNIISTDNDPTHDGFM